MQNGVKVVKLFCALLEVTDLPIFETKSFLSAWPKDA